MDFVAIDFETANHRPASACQLGVVVVKGGEIVDQHCWLIRPRPLDFSPGNIRVHGITPQQVRDEADFGQLWGEIAAVIEDQVLVAHNARFDLGVLRGCLNFYALPTPELEFTCTCSIARSTWPGQSGYGLKAIANRLGIRFRHHDALEDAVACAQILLEAAAKKRAPDLGSLERALMLTRGRAGAWGCGGPRSRGASSSGDRFWGRRRSRTSGPSAPSGPRQTRLDFRSASVQTASRLQAWLQQAEENRPFEGKKVVLTGVFGLLDRGQAERLVETAGGELGSSVTKKTRLLVVGSPDDRTLRAGRSISTKQERAEQLQNAGEPIAIETELEFLRRFEPIQEEQGGKHAVHHAAYKNGETVGDRAGPGELHRDR